QRPAWSPKGDLVQAFQFEGVGSGLRGTLELINLQGRTNFSRFLPNLRSVGQSVWTADAKTLIISFARLAEGQPQLREVSLKSGRVNDITKDLTGYSSATLSRDGQHLAAVKTQSRFSIWLSGKHD